MHGIYVCIQCYSNASCYVVTIGDINSDAPQCKLCPILCRDNLTGKLSDIQGPHTKDRQGSYASF